MQPKIRFNNFFSNWYKSKLDEHVSFFSGLTYSPDDVQEKEDGVLVLRSSNIQNNNIVYDDNVYVNKDVVNTSYVRSGDIILVVRNGSKRLIGKHALIHSYMKDTVIGAFMTGIRAKNYYFINALLDSYSFQKQIYKNLGATINQITNRDLHNMCFFFPDSLDEQKKVGYFFSILDQIIEQANQQLKQYQSLKKGLLQKLFPQGKEDVPKIRFQGFSNKWEIKELSKIARIIGGGTPSSKNECYWNGDINWFTPTELGKSKYLINSKRKITKSGLDHSSAKLLPKGTILFTSRATIGLMGIITKDSCTNQGFQSIVLNSHYYADFVYAQRLLIQKQALLRSSGSTFKEISNSEMKKINILVPSFKEQKLIGNIISCVDKLIVLQEKKINNLKALKQGLLQRMFC